jgi:hypothetical protein
MQITGEIKNGELLAAAVTARHEAVAGKLRIKNYEMIVGILTNCTSTLSPPLLRGGRGCVKKLRMQN